MAVSSNNMCASGSDLCLHMPVLKPVVTVTYSSCDNRFLEIWLGSQSWTNWQSLEMYCIPQKQLLILLLLLFPCHLPVGFLVVLKNESDSNTLITGNDLKRIKFFAASLTWCACSSKHRAWRHLLTSSMSQENKFFLLISSDEIISQEKKWTVTNKTFKTWWLYFSKSSQKWCNS